MGRYWVLLPYQGPERRWACYEPEPDWVRLFCGKPYRYGQRSTVWSRDMVKDVLGADTFSEETTMTNKNTDSTGWLAVCEECSTEVEAVITHNGVCRVGHYVHCGWGHEVDPSDMRRPDPTEYR